MEQLLNLVGLYLPSHFLEIHKLSHILAGKDMVAAAYPRKMESESASQIAYLFKT